MAMPTAAPYGAALSPTNNQGDVITISIINDEEIYNKEPQLPGAPLDHQRQTLPFHHLPGNSDWDATQAGGAMTSTPIHGTPAYNPIDGMHQYPDVTTDTGPYIVQHTYPSPPMAYHNMHPQTPYEMDAGSDAGQASHLQIQYPPQQTNPKLQVHQDFFTPSQSPMVAPRFEPNTAEPFRGRPPSKRPAIHSAANTPALYQGPSEPDANPNGWTEEQDNLVRHLKDEKKKVKQIAAELNNTFNVSRSPNAISKRWKIIKKRSSRVGSKDVIQHVMSSSLRLLNDELAKVIPGFHVSQSTTSPQNHHHHRDLQLNGIRYEAEKGFEKGFSTLVEEYMFQLQRAEAEAQGQQVQGLVQGRVQGQVQGQFERLGRHGGVNL